MSLEGNSKLLRFILRGTAECTRTLETDFLARPLAFVVTFHLMLQFSALLWCSRERHGFTKVRGIRCQGTMNVCTTFCDKHISQDS